MQAGMESNQLRKVNLLGKLPANGGY